MNGHYKIEVTRGKARLFLSSFGWGMRANATCYVTRSTAERIAQASGGIVRRWLTPAEAKLRAIAATLRAEATWCRIMAKRAEKRGNTSAQTAHLVDAERMDERADALWPRPKKGGA